MSTKWPSSRADLQAEQVFDLQGRDDHGDTGRKSDDHRIGNNLDQAPQASQAQQHEDDTGHESTDQQPTQTELMNDRQQYDDECGGRPRNIDAGAAGGRDDDACDDRGIQAMLRGYAAGDGKCHGKWQCDDAHC